ncbi:MAG: ATP-binding protein [Parabacteroides sp.]|nr:ATP-binding protein [bacterium]MDY4103233.1 ATP-binding protein [Parabacteroides sp.]MDY4550892.1 ATP-binding protein [Parabacteroides sp.]
MNRQIYNELKRWKTSQDRKPLVLLGARQVGKTWIMRHFGAQEYESVAYINCDDEPRAKELFTPDYDMDRILLSIQVITGVKVLPGKTLVILDEIQELERGLHSLKYFYEKSPQYHVMVAGSLLGITLGRGESFPVGKVDMLHMYPMNFSEFLDAMGKSELITLIHSKEWQVIELMKDKFEYLLRQYYYVGGMPKVVSKYVSNGDLAEVRKEQMAIVDAYRRDISKHTTNRESMRIGQVLDSLPSQLARENKKFVYGAVRKGARAADFELAIQWLVDAGIVLRVHRIREARMPLKFYEQLESFKLFLLDCGLLVCMADTAADQMLVDNKVFIEFKGAFTEQYVAQELFSMGIKPYYWSNDRTPAEIDFVVQKDGKAIPIEVKASTNVRSKSLAQFIKDNEGLKGLRLSLCSYIDQSWMENIPLYALEGWMSR